MNYEIHSICPAPAGLVSILKTHNGELIEPVAALGVVTERQNQHAVALVIDSELGTLSPADEDRDFDRLEWSQNLKVCKCSPTCATP